MANRTLAAIVAVTLLGGQGISIPARAENAMGYQLLPAAQAASLPRNGGSLGLDIGQGQLITGSNLTFEMLQVKSVRRGSPAARAGFKPGDQIIAVDGQVFPSVAAFAAFIGSVPPGRQINMDYLPAGAGPQQAQRVAVTLAGAGRPEDQHATGMSTGTKIAIGAAAAAMLGCYEFNCLARLRANAQAQQPQPQPQQPPQFQNQQYQNQQYQNQQYQPNGVPQRQ